MDRSPVMERASRMLQSLIEGPLLVGDLPEAPAFPHGELRLPETIPELRFDQKLGHLYEDALAILLDGSDRYDLLERNLQLQLDRHTTVGELDFLIRDLDSGTLIHLELATKFYLSLRKGETVLLPGPDPRDHYFRKLDRLRSHQLRLIARHRNHLPARWRDQAIETRHLIYGCLFDHVDDPEPFLPASLNPRCRRGKWLRFHEIPAHFPGGVTFEIIPKALWPVSPEALPGLSLEAWEAAREPERCLMVRVPSSEIPYFITPDRYPDRQPPGAR